MQAYVPWNYLIFNKGCNTSNMILLKHGFLTLAHLVLGPRIPPLTFIFQVLIFILCRSPFTGPAFLQYILLSFHSHHLRSTTHPCSPHHAKSIYTFITLLISQISYSPHKTLLIWDTFPFENSQTNSSLSLSPDSSLCGSSLWFTSNSSMSCRVLHHCPKNPTSCILWWKVR